MQSTIIYSRQIEAELEKLISKYAPRKVFLLSEEIPAQRCLPLIARLCNKYAVRKIVIRGGENQKSICSVEQVWQFLSETGADRKSLLINLGGGMLTDLGGFAASTFKRGIDFINLPTTLLSQVDASLGGKTGINFNGLKNEIGVFREPRAVIINTDFLKTIDRENFLSGYAEMIKHGLIKDREHWEELQAFGLDSIDYVSLQKIIAHSVAIKDWHVQNDPMEKDIRKALNFGHTTGHAFESLALHRGYPILHGYAVAYGMIAELYLSVKKTGFNGQDLRKATGWLLEKYGKLEITEADYDTLFQLMTHDKKNEGNRINFTLLSGIGRAEINQSCPRELILEALDYFRKL